MPTVADAQAKAAEAAHDFEICLARALDLCHTATKTIERDVLDVDTEVRFIERNEFHGIYSSVRGVLRLWNLMLSVLFAVVKQT